MCEEAWEDITLNKNESETHNWLFATPCTPGQNTRVGSLSLLQGIIFPTQGLNPGLLHSKQILYQLIYRGSPRILEWLAYPFSSRSSQLRNWTEIKLNRSLEQIKIMYIPNRMQWVNTRQNETEIILQKQLVYALQTLQHKKSCSRLNNVSQICPHSNPQSLCMLLNMAKGLS